MSVAARCGVCHSVLDHPTRGAVCERCWRACARFSPPLCDRCGVPLDTCELAPEPEVNAAPGARNAEPAVCARCRRRPGLVARARAIGPHEGALRDVVHALKYGGLTSIATRLATLMRECGEGDVLADADAVVPVPLHPRREWQRGFNQAELLAAGLGVPMRRLLCRRKPTRPQASLHAADRQRNVGGAFALAALPRARGWAAWVNLFDAAPRARTRGAVAGRVLVLVDDVSTTGATLEACARVLLEQGAREVRALTAARAVLARRQPRRPRRSRPGVRR